MRCYSNNNSNLYCALGLHFVKCKEINLKRKKAQHGQSGFSTIQQDLFIFIFLILEPEWEVFLVKKFASSLVTLVFQANWPFGLVSVVLLWSDKAEGNLTAAQGRALNAQSSVDLDSYIIIWSNEHLSYRIHSFLFHKGKG